MVEHNINGIEAKLLMNSQRRLAQKKWRVSVNNNIFIQTLDIVLSHWIMDSGQMGLDLGKDASRVGIKINTGHRSLVTSPYMQ